MATHLPVIIHLRQSVKVMGTVESSQVTISFFADPGMGQEVPVMYEGTVDGDAVWTGTLDLARGLATGTFRATQS